MTTTATVVGKIQQNFPIWEDLEIREEQKNPKNPKEKPKNPVKEKHEKHAENKVLYKF